MGGRTESDRGAVIDVKQPPALLGHFLGFVIVLAIAWPAYHWFLEDDSGVWVSTSDPSVQGLVFEGVKTRWEGYRRRSCAYVEWHYRVMSGGAVIWSGMSLAGDNTPSEETVEEWTLPLPTFVGGKGLLYEVVEVARCNPFRAWTNVQAVFNLGAYR